VISGIFILMVWPILPLVSEGLLRVALLSSLVAGVLLSAKSGLITLLCFGALCRVKQAVLGPTTKPAGFCSREEHKERVAEASAAAKKPGPLRMFKATASNTFRVQQIKNREQSQARLDLSRFVHVLEINKEELWCDIEASATFETFSDAAMFQGTVPLVVPELRTITVGGAVVGMGIESSSFKHGFFHEGLLEADVLLPSGEVVTAKPTGDYEDLFKALPNSLGSFGYLLRLRMRIQPAKSIVKINKVWFKSPELLVKGLEDACGNADADYVDAVALSDAGGMVITGSFVDKVPTGDKLKPYGYWPIFYKTLTHEGMEYIPTENYLWRWDADWFWVAQVFPGLSFWIVRWLCGPEMLRSDIYKVFNDAVISNFSGPLGLTKNEELVIQDIEIPLNRSADYIREFIQAVPSNRIGKIKLSRPGSSKTTVPIWLCPVIRTAAPLFPMEDSKLFINFGFWDALKGPETKGGLSTGRINSALEALTVKYGGIKTLYSTVYWPEEEFYKIYNEAHYKMIKAKYDPDGRLRSLYERVTRA